MYFSPLQKLKVTLLAIVAICIFAPISIHAASSNLVIDEFRTRSDNDVSDEYVTIANYSETSKDMTGFTLKKKTASLGSNPSIMYQFGVFSLGPGERFHITKAMYTGSATLADTDNIILLYDNGSPAKIVDSVAYGNVNFADIEGVALKNPARAVAYRRTTIPENNNNALDFEAFIVVVPPDLNADKIVISELLPSPESGKEWFELYNPTNLDIRLANLKICDALGSRKCYIFADDDVLKPGIYKVYDQTLTGITLNNNGDWLEIYDLADNFMTDSGGNYGTADKGVSLALFGSEYQWTASPTSGSQNVFANTVELEQEAKSTKKTTKSKIKLASTKNTVATSPPSEEGETQKGADNEVKGSNVVAAESQAKQAVISRRTMGLTLIGLAILLLLGYTLWYFRDYAKDIYHKISKGDDSARF